MNWKGFQCLCKLKACGGSRSQAGWVSLQLSLSELTRFQCLCKFKACGGTWPEAGCGFFYIEASGD